MTAALLYQPNERWRIGAALVAGALIHLGAIAFATYPREQIFDTPSIPGLTELTFEPASPPDDSTPPPETVAPSPSQDTAEPLFTEARTTPPPIRRQEHKRATPIVKANTSAGSLSLSSAKVVALSAPLPEYPYEARRQRITGSGIVAMTVDPITGSVTEVSMEQSTGSPYLDNAAKAGFRRWRFKPGTAFRIKSPITYTLTGAAY